MITNKILNITGMLGLLAIIFSNRVYKNEMITTTVSIVVITVLLIMRFKKSE